MELSGTSDFLIGAINGGKISTLGHGCWRQLQATSAGVACDSSLNEA